MVRFEFKSDPVKSIKNADSFQTDLFLISSAGFFKGDCLIGVHCAYFFITSSFQSHRCAGYYYT